MVAAQRCDVCKSEMWRGVEDEACEESLATIGLLTGIGRVPRAR